MTAIFKVVEFYRLNTTNINVNNLNSNQNSTSLLNTSINDSKLDDETNDLIKNNKKTFPTTQSSSSISSNGSNSIYNTLGFNVLGGYSTDFPATITDVAANFNGKALKVLRI